MLAPLGTAGDVVAADGLGLCVRFDLFCLFDFEPSFSAKPLRLLPDSLAWVMLALTLFPSEVACSLLHTNLWLLG